MVPAHGFSLSVELAQILRGHAEPTRPDQVCCVVVIQFDSTSRGFLRAFVPRFAWALGPQRSAPRSDGEQRAENNYGVDAGAALEGPDGVPDAEPHGELVQGEGGSHAIEDGDEAAGKERGRCGACAHLRDHGVAGDEEQENAPDEMVDVSAGHDHPSEGSDVKEDEEDKEAHAQEGEGEAQRGQKEATARAIGDALVQDAAGAGPVQQEKDHRCARCHEDEEDPRSLPVHDHHSDSLADQRDSHQSCNGSQGVHHHATGIYRQVERGGTGRRGVRRQRLRMTSLVHEQSQTRAGGIAESESVWFGGGGLWLREQRSATRADGQQRAKQDDSVDALASLARPVSVRAQVEPEREFIERKGCAHAERDGD